MSLTQAQVVEAVAAEVHEHAQRGTTPPPGAASFPGGDAILNAALAKLKAMALEELRALVDLIKQRLDQYAGPTPAGHPTSE